MLADNRSLEQQDEVDRVNAAFWDELCGSQAARALGITDSSAASIKKFDDWYFQFYPYLERHIPFAELRGRAVLEVGLGYGTVSQRLAECGASYSGLDIAAGPVGMVNHRLKLLGLPGKAHQGSVLAAPFPDGAFDHIIAIGCFHHTGNIQKAIDESYRMLRAGGHLTFMTYYAYSYRRLMQAPRACLTSLLQDVFGASASVRSTAADRASYDINSDGQAAPVTEFVSGHQIRHLTRQFSETRTSLENAAPEGVFRRFQRETLLGSPVARWLGLDIYVTARK